MAGASVWVDGAVLPQLPSVLDCSPPRRLVLDRPTARQPELGGPVPAFDVHSRHIYGGLVSLTISHGPIHRNTRALFTALALMPRLEELELFLVTFSPYDEDLPVPTFRLRKYVYCNVRTFEPPRANTLGSVSTWSLPLAVSANTLRHLCVSLRGSHEAQEALSLPSLALLEHLELRGYWIYGFPEDTSGYGALIARCPRLRLLALHAMRHSDIVRNQALVSSAVTMLHQLDISFLREHAPVDWEHAEVDTALACAARFAASAPAPRFDAPASPSFRNAGSGAHHHTRCVHTAADCAASRHAVTVWNVWHLTISLDTLGLRCTIVAPDSAGTARGYLDMSEPRWFLHGGVVGPCTTKWMRRTFDALFLGVDQAGTAPRRAVSQGV